MVGLPVTKTRLDAVLGGLAKRVNDDFAEIALLKQWRDITNQTDIEALGFNEDEAYLIGLIIDELAQLRGIYVGTNTLATAKDFRFHVMKAWGLGV